jgi:hypothetical protein
MRVDLHKRGTSRNRLLLTGQAIMPALIILTTSVSCSKRAAEVSEPPYRIVERILPFCSSSSGEENRQLVQRRSDANRLFNWSSTGPPRPQRSPRYMRRIGAAQLLRATLRERQTRRRYSIGTKRSCSNNSSNGGSVTRTCRKDPMLTPVLFVKPYRTTPRRRIGGLRHPASSTSCARPFGRAAPIGHVETDRSTGRWHRLTCQGPEGSRERFAEPAA